jgi:hypothetical protein
MVAGKRGSTGASNFEFVWNLEFILLSSDFCLLNQIIFIFVNPLTITPALWITKFFN